MTDTKQKTKAEFVSISETGEVVGTHDSKRDGYTIMHEFAARAQDASGISLLIEDGADVNVRDKWGGTPLHLAAYNNNFDIFTALFNAGADVNARDGLEKDTPLHWVAQYSENPKMASILLDAGVDVNAQNYGHLTPLHKAAESNKNADLISFLIENGANVNVRAKDGSTPLLKAVAFNETPEIVSTLINAGADVNERYSDLETPLHMAMVSREPEIVSILIGAGADINARNELGQTPLHSAAPAHRMLTHHKSSEIISILIEAGAALNAKDNNGKTALAYVLNFINKNRRFKKNPAHQKLLNMLTPAYLPVSKNYCRPYSERCCDVFSRFLVYLRDTFGGNKN